MQRTVNFENIQEGIEQYAEERESYERLAGTTSDPYHREMFLLGAMEAGENLYLHNAALLFLNGHLTRKEFYIEQREYLDKRRQRYDSIIEAFSKKLETETDPEFIDYLKNVLDKTRHERTSITCSLDQVESEIRDAD
jgi:hypothetical protein